ncbi:asparaginase [Ancylobacter rudongensis]|uniref:L-asparaginase n=1 Tax=Ancylobacter rudongensis TaxID=177413 RepID=A0A1G4SQA1_9HYPH|nr:asparaginase [Ancylobacter rudongensis]SCW71404.1 L-asparaginase [Ancylobacter rudongensis]
MSIPRLLVLSLGGTITMTAGAGGGISPTLGAAELVAAVPGLGELAQIEARSPLKVGSASLTLENIAAVAAEIRAGFAQGFDGALVIQGTDTIEETAFALDLLVGDERPVVVVGAMRGPQQPGADGPANLLAAALVATSEAARGLGTLVVMNDEIHAARFVRKAHTALTSAFVSEMAGPLGLVAEGRVRLLARVARPALPTLEAGLAALPPVALLKIAMGDDGRVLRAVPGLGFAGLVIEGAGAGHVPGVMAESLGEVAAHMPVVLASRTLAGPVFERTYAYPGSEIDLLARGALSAGLLTGVKARLLLTLALAAGWDRAALARAFAAYG